MMDYEERTRLNTVWRGRRLVACRSIGALDEVIRALPEGPYSQIKSGHDCNEGPFPGTTPQMKQELLNMSSLLLRMVLTASDGHVSPQTLRSF
jgi:hypothetical protein